MSCTFLVVSTRLYKRVCPSVRMSVRPSGKWTLARRAETKTANDLCRVSGLVLAKVIWGHEWNWAIHKSLYGATSILRPIDITLIPWSYTLSYGSKLYVFLEKAALSWFQANTDTLSVSCGVGVKCTCCGGGLAAGVKVWELQSGSFGVGVATGGSQSYPGLCQLYFPSKWRTCQFGWLLHQGLWIIFPTSHHWRRKIFTYLESATSYEPRFLKSRFFRRHLKF